MDIPVEIRYKCIAEYKTSTDFEDELVEASLAGFILQEPQCAPEENSPEAGFEAASPGQ